MRLNSSNRGAAGVAGSRTAPSQSFAGRKFRFRRWEEEKVRQSACSGTDANAAAELDARRGAGGGASTSSRRRVRLRTCRKTAALTAMGCARARLELCEAVDSRWMVYPLKSHGKSQLRWLLGEHI